MISGFQGFLFEGFRYSDDSFFIGAKAHDGAFIRNPFFDFNDIAMLFGSFNINDVHPAINNNLLSDRKVCIPECRIEIHAPFSTANVDIDGAVFV